MSNVGKVKNVLKGIVDGIPLDDLESKSVYELQAMLRVIRKSAKLAYKECKRIEWNEKNAVSVEEGQTDSTQVATPIEGEVVAVEKEILELKPWFSQKKSLPAQIEVSVLEKSEKAVRTKEHGWIPKSTIVSEKKVS